MSYDDSDFLFEEAHGDIDALRAALDEARAQLDVLKDAFTAVIHTVDEVRSLIYQGDTDDMSELM